MTSRAAIAFDWLNEEVGELRRRYERCFAVADAGPSAWKSVESGPRLLVQQPRRLRRGDHAIVYFHGGGWIVGSPLTHADISRALCETTGLRLASVEYRLAPEHRAPAPVEDGCRALADVLQTAAAAFLCGDSAGTAIALAVERRAEPALRRRILGIGAFYGAFGLPGTASLRAFGARSEGLDAACVARMWALANDPQRPSPYAIEALAAASGAPVYLLAAERDPLRDDTLALAAAYRACGRAHIRDLVEGATHGFLHDTHTAAASAALERVSDWVRFDAR